jgi:hypothetical protein
MIAWSSSEMIPLRWDMGFMILSLEVFTKIEPFCEVMPLYMFMQRDVYISTKIGVKE